MVRNSIRRNGRMSSAFGPVAATPETPLSGRTDSRPKAQEVWPMLGRRYYLPAFFKAANSSAELGLAAFFSMTIPSGLIFLP